jgi:hypothetical protein
MVHESEPLMVDAAQDRGWVQSADVIMQDHVSVRAAAAWACDVLDTYPGCVLAAARHVEGCWLLLAARGAIRPSVLHLPRNMITPAVARELLRIALCCLRDEGGHR